MSASIIHRTVVGVDVGDDLDARNISPFDREPDEPGEGQAQITFGHIVTLHLSGTPASWRHLAKVIEDAAMDLERQIAEQADPGEHYADMAAESGVKA